MYIFSFLFWPILIIALIGFFIRRRIKKSHPSQNKDWYLQLSLSKEDAVSQLFLLISFFFLGVTLLAFNKDFGDPFSWRTILLFTSVAGLFGAYYLKTIYTLVFSLVGLTSWWGAQAAEWVDGKNIKVAPLYTGLLFIALLFYVLGHLHERQLKYKRFALVYLILGILAVTVALFFFSTKPGISALGIITGGVSFLGSWQLTLSLFVFFCAVVGLSIFAVTQKLMNPAELIVVLVLFCLFGVMAFLPKQNMFENGSGMYGYYYGQGNLSSTGILWALVYNFAIFFELLGLIFSGYVRRESWLINLGALFLFLLIIVKYFDWFFTFLDKSIFFIGAGILLFAVGWFMERGRKYMISNIEAQSKQVLQ